MTSTPLQSHQKRRWRGIAAAPGIALGPAFVYRVSTAEPRLRRLHSDTEVSAESQRLEQALIAVKEELRALKKVAGPSVGSALNKIFDAQILIVDDNTIVADVQAQIARDRIGAENAFTRVVEDARRAISRSSDPYLREMINDIDAVKTRVVNRLLGITETLNQPLTEPVIVLAANITPSDIVSLRREFVRGIVTESGGETSHTALLAKSLRIPAVVGVDFDVRTVRPGSMVAVDGFDGRVIVDPDTATVGFFERKKKRTRSPWPKKYNALQSLPAITQDRHRISLMANIDLVGETTRVVSAGADGVGLYRTEYLFLEKGSYPTEREQFRVYRQAVDTLQGRPMVVRTFDLGSDKALSGFPSEANPALGVRGIRLALRSPAALKAQFRALLAASAFGPVHVMIPMVTDTEEVAVVKGFWQEAKAALRARGVKYDTKTPLGIMIETPSAVQLIDEFTNSVDFVSIGTNDLLQYTRAADRGNQAVNDPNDRWHPGLWRQIAAVCKQARKAKCPVGLCGELGSEILAIPFLIGAGFNSISCQPNSVPHIKALIRTLRYTDAKAAMDTLLTKGNRADILRLAKRVTAKYKGKY